MTIKYYADQSVVDTPRRKEETPERKQNKSLAQKSKQTTEKRERIAMVDGKLAIVSK